MKDNNIILELIENTRNSSAEQLLEYIVNHFGDKVALSSSFGLEDQVLTDMLCTITNKVNIFTLDTGRLPEQTYEVMEKTRQRYGVQITVLFPDYKKVEEMVNQHGPNLFYNSVENRKLCCNIRKVEPLKRQLAKYDAWICGLRTEQSTTRDDLEPIQWDDNFGLIKICPLANWKTKQVWDYIHKNNVPYNKLHDEGYPSIGCAPCTRAVEPGEDIRAGRWWWEKPIHKECGLHLKTDKKNVKKE